MWNDIEKWRKHTISTASFTSSSKYHSAWCSRHTQQYDLSSGRPCRNSRSLTDARKLKTFICQPFNTICWTTSCTSIPELLKYIAHAQLIIPSIPRTNTVFTHTLTTFQHNLEHRTPNPGVEHNSHHPNHGRTTIPQLSVRGPEATAAALNTAVLGHQRCDSDS